jgi:CYTH domain-containing protein/CHAD domain-containing protein
MRLGREPWSSLGTAVWRHRRAGAVVLVVWTAVRLDARRPRHGAQAPEAPPPPEVPRPPEAQPAPLVPGGIEVERKFLVVRLPGDLDSFPAELIEQGYLALDGDVEVRVRRRGERSPVLTIKSGGGLARVEEEFEIGEERFTALWPLTAGRRVEKTRYTVPAGGDLVFELDVYAGALGGLMTAEVEFQSVEASALFEPPGWLGREVTEDPSYKNQALAHRAGEAKASRAFRLRVDERIPDGIRRIALGQVDQVLDMLEGRSGEESSKAVHESRKSLKRLRALVRLAHAELGDHLSSLENAAYRDAGRVLSGPRDSQVMIDALDSLIERYPEEAGRADLEAFRSHLVQTHEAVARELAPGAPAFADVESAARAARDRILAWPLDHNSFDVLAPGLARAYRRGRRAHRTARKDPNPEHLHEWRKRVKDLWYSLQILEAAAPKRMKALALNAKELSELLGDDHDLVVLEQRAAENPGDFRNQSSAEVLRELSERRRAELQGRAFGMASRLYRDAPKAFVRRIEKGWRKRARKRR